ncbi:MAG: hypothetical protein QXO32_08675 [Candidatus Bathyarchaeia archaeon]
MVKEEPVWKRGLLDLSIAFFLIGGVVSLISVLTMIPISTIYPFKLKPSISFTLIVGLVVALICAIEAFECYRFASRRMLSKSGIRGIVIGAILLSIGMLEGRDLRSQMLIASAVLILIAGVISYIYRE